MDRADNIGLGLEDDNMEAEKVKMGNIRNRMNKLIIDKAVIEQKNDLVSYLNVTDKSMLNKLFMRSVEHNNVNLLKTLTTNHDDIDIHFDNDFALIIGANINSLEMIKALHNLGLNLGSYNNGCLKIAIQNRNLELIKYLINNNCKCDGSMIQSATDDDEVFKYLFDKTTDCLDEILDELCQKNKLDLIQYIEAMDVDCSCCLFYASMYNQMDIVQYITSNIYLDRSLIVANQMKNDEILEYLKTRDPTNAVINIL